jgi:hypothetical protein
MTTRTTQTTAHPVRAAAAPVIRRTVVSVSTLLNPPRFAHMSAEPIVVANADSQTRNRKLIQPGESSSLASNCRRTTST